MLKKRILIYQNEFSSYGGDKTANDIELGLKTKFNFFRISNLNVKFKLQYKLIKVINNFLSYFFNESITIPFTPVLSKKKIKYDKILIGYANEIYSLNKLNNSKIKKIFIVNDEWIFNGFSHFNLHGNRYKDILIKLIQIYTFNLIKKKLDKSRSFYFIFSCNYFKNIALKKFNLPYQNHITIKNPINTKFWKKKNLRLVNNIKKKLLLNKNYFYILIYLRNGFENYRKGGDRFKKLISSLKKYDDIKFIIIGTTRKDQIQNCIFIQTRDLYFIKEIIYASNISINLSRAEGIPYSILETMSCGTPVISMNSGGINEIINNNVNGFLFSKFNSRQIIKKIFFLKNNKKILNRLGNNASLDVLTKHGQKKILRDYFKILKN